MTELETCLAFIRSFEERRARRVVPFRFGKALFDDELPRAWDLNLLAVQPGPGAEPTAEQLIEDADRIQGGAELEHRKLEVLDEELGERLAPRFAERGWTVVRDLIMPRVRETDLVDTYLIREVSGEELAPTWAEGIRSAPWADEETVRQLVAAQFLRRKAARVRYFAAFEGGQVAGYCELFSDGKTGQIESVLTVPEYRRRGHGRAVVTKALEVSRAMGHSLTFLRAHEDDWPKELYRSIGFETAGRVLTFTRSPGRPPSSAT